MKRLLTKDLQFYRVWPDGTVQDSEDRPYEWKSDDYLMVEADSEEEALERVMALESAASKGTVTWARC